MLWPFAVDRTLMFDTERARLSPPDTMSTHFDLQPAIAACRTASAGSLILRFHRKDRSMCARRYRFAGEKVFDMGQTIDGCHSARQCPKWGYELPHRERSGEIPYPRPRRAPAAPIGRGGRAGSNLL